MNNEELIEDLPSMTTYPHKDGDVFVLGPEIFASTDTPSKDTVISWQGENFTPDSLEDETPKEDKYTVTYKPDSVNDFVYWELCKNGDLVASGYASDEADSLEAATRAKDDDQAIKVIEL